MPEIKVLIVDDSPLARDFIRAILSIDSEIVIVGEAENGKVAIAKTKELHPDLVIMDIEMPVMGGLEAIERIMCEVPTPIMVVTSRGESETAFMAISKGALEVVPKSEVDPDRPRKFIDQVKILARARVITHVMGRCKIQPDPLVKEERLPFKNIIAIASSTGGPNALNVILPNFSKDFSCPIVIAQHIADGFIIGLSEWLAKISHVAVKVGEEGDTLLPGHVYISPPDRHMVVNYGNRISFIERKARDIHHPSCDILLMSVGTVYGAKAIGVILTGMGMDGVQGMMKIKEMKGRTIAQDEKTSIVYGMPKVAIEAGCVDTILPLESIGKELLKMVSG
ncbi:MAG: chemotaxis-specific protein-glutamate methyltransferase CheB [Proteobacteria bacterium]|nr:chemotaxis-specific protein-glutamate methyltransferase CheB [Pseudomonadota bacterium]MBU1687302.1 chemotaxis-specific protein-glutamate methyltransferase CheB [Pseudomonadota bacterium]